MVRLLKASWSRNGGSYWVSASCKWTPDAITRCPAFGALYAILVVDVAGAGEFWLSEEGARNCLR